jgi:primary-amine oxidase
VNAAAAFHPLDPLSAGEIEAVAAAVKAREEYAGQRFITIELREPDKAASRAWDEPGADRPPREADVVLLDRADGSTHEVAVDLAAGVTAWQRRDDVQPMAVVAELMEAAELIKRDPEFRAAMRRRGIERLDSVEIDAWPAGHFGLPEESERRLARGLAYVRPEPGDSEWAHPVEGVVALVDLNRLEVLRVEDHGVVPIPPEPGNFGPEDAGPLRDDVKPLHITQPEGPSFSLEGRVLRWQNWQLHVGFSAREGLVLHRVGYRDGGRVRPVLHRASLSEMVVPYGDPSPTHYFKNAFDAGENGVGVSAASLVLGCDCLGEIRYLDAVVADAAGAPVRIPNAICIHEEDSGVLWRHVDWRDGRGEVRRGRRLVVSSFAAIGNYDYGFFWYLHQDGTIAHEVKLTGVLSTGAVAPGERPAHGVLVAPGLNAIVHQHFFNVRLDMEVDGPENAVDEVWTEPLPPGEGNPHGNAFAARRRRLASESEARRSTDAASARWWEVVNPGRRHRLGEPVAYRLVPGENTIPFAQPDAPVRRRAGFIDHHVWVTAYDPGERFAAGDYPNQHAGGSGLPEWTARDRDLDGTDIVLWYTFGHHHVPRPEDWPVMPVATIGFQLKPVGFFERNPSLDVPPPRPE